MKNNNTTKITSFIDLYAWKEAHKLAINIYKITKLFPKEEIYSLSDQLKRACVSITSNIAEGFSRASKQEKRQFFSIAKGSLTEVQNQILLAKDVGYLAKQNFQELAEKTVVVHKLINGLLKSSMSKAR